MPKKLSLLSLFSGLGGLDIGLEAAGFENVGVLEFDKSARRAIAANRSDWPILEPNDVNEFASSLQGTYRSSLNDIDLIAGGPPCQPFSAAAQWHLSGRAGMQDSRARTIESTLDIVEAVKPRAVLIENVVGFVQGRGSAVEYIRHRLKQINLKHGTMYALSVTVVDAYAIGVPQRRKRAILFAERDGRGITVPQFDVSKRRTAWDAIGTIDPGTKRPATGRWAELLPCIPEGTNYQYLTSVGRGPELFGYRTKYWSFLLKLAKEQPAWTLPASGGPATGPFHWENRKLTTREALRLQSFPVDWEVPFGVNVAQRLIGNATPPLLAEVIGREISDLLVERVRHRKSPYKLAIPRVETPAPPPAPVANVPASFASLIGPKLQHAGVGRGPGRLTQLGHRPS